MHECVNALMRIKRWIWGAVSELGLNHGLRGKNPFENTFRTLFWASLCISSISMVGFHNLMVKQQIPQKTTEFSDLLKLTENLSCERGGKRF